MRENGPRSGRFIFQENQAVSSSTLVKHSTFEHYRRLRRLIQTGLLIAYLIPLLFIFLYFHFQSIPSLKETGKMNLTLIAESQRNTLDLFLQERVMNIFNLFHSDFNLPPSADEMYSFLLNLRQMSEAFVDVGFINHQGIQSGYSGPFSYLRGKDYSDEFWFKTLMSQDRNYYITDIYLGFRQEPHFTIAVRQLVEGRQIVLRATLDPERFYQFLHHIVRDKGTDSQVINHEGQYQLVSPQEGKLLSPSPYKLEGTAGYGSFEMRTDRGPSLVAFAWLNEVPWAVVVKQPLDLAYREMYQARKVLLTTTGLLMGGLILAVFLVTNRLMVRAQRLEAERYELQSQLIHAGKLLSVGELAAGIAHEINNPLQIIASESGVIRDLFDPEFGLDPKPATILEEIDVIEQAVYRARDITQKLLRFARKSEPKLVMGDVNRLLAQVVDGFIEKELNVSNITVVRDFAPEIPQIALDLDQTRQVFLNIINNARDAIAGSGTITLSSQIHNGQVRIAITDTGKGMTVEQIEKIFLPFYTTKEVGKGTGLGLSISLSIVESMGGRIEVQSMPGAGSSFIIILPMTQLEVAGNGTEQQ